MNLIICAHKNEASSFFHYHDCQELNLYKNLYRVDTNLFLLITGEGLWDSITSTMHALHLLKSANIDISKLINLGVVGSLRPELKKFDLFSIRTSYGYSGENQCEFHSYSAPDLSSTNIGVVGDCLSSYKRLNTAEEKKSVTPFAHVVDRELWSIAKVASLYAIPWYSLKLVSDEYREENVCQLVQNLAHEFSSRLYESCKTLMEKINQPLLNTSTNEMSIKHQQILNFLHEKSLYLTFSQKQQVFDYFERVIQQEQISTAELFSIIPFQNWGDFRPKEKSQMLIQWLKLRLTPHLGSHTTNIQNWITRMQAGNKNLHLNLVDQSEALEVKFKSYSEEDWKKYLSILEKINRSELDNFFRNNNI